MEYFTIFVIAVVAYAILVALTYFAFKLSKDIIKKPAENAEVGPVELEIVIDNNLEINESEPPSS